MTRLRDAAQQALRALVHDQMGVAVPPWDSRKEMTSAAITALRAALAEPVQEPVAWMDIDSDGNRLSVRQWSDGNRDEVPLYTAPPLRKPLTDQAIWREYQGLWPFHPAETPALANDILKFARAIERAHGIGGSDEA